MSIHPKISIIIPAWNAEKTIKKCLDSIFDQTYKDYEIIVVNDGSTDHTKNILKIFLNKIKIVNQENKGAPAARNRGLREAKGEYLLFCDADVVMRPDCLEKMMYYLFNNTEASYAYSSFKFSGKRFRLWPFDAEKLKQVNYIHSTSLIRREHFPVSGWDESLTKFQDWDLWLTMMEQGHHGVWIPHMLFKVVGKGTMSSWMPKIFYKVPWNSLGWKPKGIDKYEKAKEIIEKKHHLK